MSGLKVHTAWSTSAVTTAEAKTHMRIDSSFTDDDTYIGNLVTASQNMVEQITGRAITHQTLQLFLDNCYKYKYFVLIHECNDNCVCDLYFRQK